MVGQSLIARDRVDLGNEQNDRLKAPRPGPRGPAPRPPRATILLLVLVVGCSNRGLDERGVRGVGIVGGPGSRDGRLVTPRAVAVAGDSFWVIDRSGRAQRFSLDGALERVVPIALGERGFPIGALGQEDGGVLLCDTHQARLRLLDRDGAVMKSVGGPGHGLGQFEFPQRAARASDGRIFVSEFGTSVSNRVQVFNAALEPMQTFGTFGYGEGKFSRAMGIVVVDDEVFIADADDRILVFSTDGRFLRQFGQSGSGIGELRYPYGLCRRGNEIIVAEHANHRIQRFDRRGQSRGTFGRAGQAPGEFRGPWDVACDRRGRLVVADSGNHRIVLIDPDLVTWAR